MLKVFILILTIFVVFPTATKARTTACLSTPGQQCWFNKWQERDSVCTDNCYGNDRFSYASGFGKCYCCRNNCSNRPVCTKSTNNVKILPDLILSTVLLLDLS